MSLPKYSVYVGYDSREQEAYDVCEFTLKKYNGVNVEVYKLDHRMLRRYNWFSRRWLIDEDGQYWDEEDGKPFSTEFSHSRFLAPYMAKRHYAEDGSCGTLDIRPINLSLILLKLIKLQVLVYTLSVG